MDVKTNVYGTQPKEILKKNFLRWIYSNTVAEELDNCTESQLDFLKSQIDSSFANTETYLCVAIKFSRLDTVKDLVERLKANVYHRDAYGKSLLFKACQSTVDTAKKIRYLASNFPKLFLLRTHESQSLPVHIAALQPCTDAIQAILELDAGMVNARKQFLSTPLHLSARHNRIDVVQLLTDLARTNVNLRDLNGDTAAHNAALHEHIDCLAAIVARSDFQRSIRNRHYRTYMDVLEGHLHTKYVNRLFIRAEIYKHKKRSLRKARDL